MTSRRLVPLIAASALVLAAGVGVVVGVSVAAQAPVPAPAPDGGAPAALSSKVRIVFQTVPPEKATVMWGRKSLGEIRGKNRPLIIERPRDSGPLDVVIRAKGYIPVHTRAHTFTDNKLYVTINKIEEKKTLFGYREELPDAGAPEAGLPGTAAVGPPAPIGPQAPDAGVR